MATQDSGSRGGDKNDHKAQLDGGLRMKIMRSKANDSALESMHKSAKTELNGVQAGLKSNIGTSSSAKNKSKEPKSQAPVQCSQPSTAATSEMFAENSSVGIPAVAFNMKNVPVSKLFSTQNPNYQYSCRSYSSLNACPEVNEVNPEATDAHKSPGKRKPADTAKESSQNGSDNVQSAADSSNLNESPPSKKKRESCCAKVNRCVGTSFGTITEPECLGPCEPGTSVNLDGIVWHETEDGILVVNATWRGRSYVGTLLDSTRHDWAPPRPNDGNEDWDCRTRAGRAKRRNAVYGPELNTPSSSKPRNNNFKTRSSREMQLQEGTSAYQAKPVTPRSEIRKSKEELSSNDESSQQKDTQRLVNPVTGLQVKIPNSQWQNVAPCPVSPVLFECPEQDCSKKYKNLDGLRYHQSRVHGADCFDDDSMQSTDSQKPLAASQQDTLISNNILSLNNEAEIKTGEEDSSSSKMSFINRSDSKIGSNEANELTSKSFSTINQDIARLQESLEENCDRNIVLNSKDSHNQCANESVLKMIESQERDETCGANDQPTMALLSVKKDIFETPRLDTTEPNTEKHKSSPFKLFTPHQEHFPSILDGGRSPAYSDISDDSLSFSSSDFIDKLLKSTECKTPQAGVGGNFDLGFQPQHLQHYSNLSLEKDSNLPKSIESNQQLQSNDNIKKELDINEYSRMSSTLPGQSNPTSSTFINPYKLQSSNFIADPIGITGDFKSQTDDAVNDVPPKKENNSCKKEELREVPDKNPQQIKQETVDSQNNSSLITSLTGLTSVQNLTFKSENEMHLPEKAQQIATETSYLTNAMDNKCQSPSQFSQSRNSNKQQSAQSKRPATSQGSMPTSSKNDQQRNQSPGNLNRNIKEEKNIRIKHEPQMPAMSRSSGTPQFLHQPQFMTPSYPFVPAFSPYPNSIPPNTGYSMPYYNTQLPRYPLPADQSKQSNMTPQYVPNPTFGNANFSAPSTLSNFSNTQTSPSSTMANINSAARAQVGIGNGRPQTHFHTHHHTHVGLGYPVYSASYEGPLLPSQQGTPAVMPTYSPRPTK